MATKIVNSRYIAYNNGSVLVTGMSKAELKVFLSTFKLGVSISNFSISKEDVIWDDTNNQLYVQASSVNIADLYGE